MSDSNQQSVSKKKASTKQGSLEVMTAFQGPLPSPEILQGFENVLPGAAGRILEMTEREQGARHKIENKYANGSIAMMALGIFSGLVALLTIGYLIKYSIDNEADNVAIVLASTSLVGVISVFVWFNRVRKRTKD
jgi:uncharacterized membrane protein